MLGYSDAESELLRNWFYAYYPRPKILEVLIFRYF